jgi:7-keto-8-aminopelargonate synthetase-like enzyme
MIRESARRGTRLTAGLRHGFCPLICGTQEQHKQLEHDIASFWAQKIILYSSLRRQRRLLEMLLGAEDAVISDELNHASIIDGIRLRKRNASVTRIATWRIWNSSSRLPRARISA